MSLRAVHGSCRCVPLCRCHRVVPLMRASPRLPHQVSEDVLSKEQRDSLPLHESCKPFFVFYKVRVLGAPVLARLPVALLINACVLALPQHKVIIGKIFGANAPEIEAIIADNIFPKREEE